jgi:hypothetical protein
MSSVPPPPAAPAPPPVSYPDTEGRIGHRLGPGVVGLIVAVVLLVAAVLTAGVVLTGNTTNPSPPPKPTMPSKLLSAPPTAAAAQQGTGTLQVNTVPGINTELWSSAAAVDLGDGVSLTPAPGWTVEDTDEGFVAVVNAGGTAVMWVGMGPVNSKDVAQVLQADINGFTSGKNSVLQNVQLSDVQTGSVKGDNFDELALVGYNADYSTQQGTVAVIGMFFELLNTSTGNAAFGDLMIGDDNAADQATSDAADMINSML